MFRKMGLAASVAALFAVSGSQALSQTVTIETVDGNVSLQGTILSFDGENYEFESGLGRTVIAAASVICLGEACPEIDDDRLLDADVVVLDQPSRRVLDGLMGAFAADNGLTVQSGPDVFAFTDQAGFNAGRTTVSSLDQRAAFQSLLDGETQVIFSTMPISDALAEEFVALDFPDLRAPGREVVIALDAIVPIIHQDNMVRDLSLTTLAQIAAGRFTNWSQLGGEDVPIRLVLPEKGSSVSTLIEDRMMRPNRMRMSSRLERVATEADAAAIVADDPYAMALVSSALAQDVRQLPIRQVCGPLSVPTDFSMKAEEYTLSRRVFMYTSTQELSESVKQLLSYAGSEDAQAQYIDVGFFGQTVEQVPLYLQGARMANAILQAETPEMFAATRRLTETLTSADRLSTTFRFEEGTVELDNKSRRDAVRIAAYLTRPEHMARDILLFGFTDDAAQDDLNQLLSLQQANNISQAIIAASNGQISADRIIVTSYGSIAPVDCNETAEGRNSNRRVEVWLR